ncbi:hypothetical protein HI914_02806 [Erysiphe necator]|nr:hypothetical protein HI914_02806 [Erysiphe necator]
MAITEVSARISFLNDSAHLLFACAPETSRYLMMKRNKLAFDNNIDLAETRMSKTCNACGTMMIIGWQGSISNVSGISNEKKKKRKKVADKKQQPRLLIYECNTCHRKTRQILSTNLKTLKDRRSLKMTQLKLESFKNNSEAESKPQNLSTPTLSTRKRRKTKKITLETLIEQKKDPQPSSFGFDLMDFLKKA